jgi:hypothetical protein
MTFSARDFDGLVGAAVRDDDDFELAIVLTPERIQGPQEVGFFIMRGDDH